MFIYFILIFVLILTVFPFILKKKKIKIYLYFTKWCKYSNLFIKNIWNRLKLKENIEFIEIDCDKKDSLCKKKNIEYYPTIIINNNDNTMNYEGKLNYEILNNFIENL